MRIIVIPLCPTCVHSVTPHIMARPVAKMNDFTTCNKHCATNLKVDTEIICSAQSLLVTRGLLAYLTRYLPHIWYCVCWVNQRICCIVVHEVAPHILIHIIQAHSITNSHWLSKYITDVRKYLTLYILGSAIIYVNTYFIIDNWWPGQGYVAVERYIYRYYTEDLQTIYLDMRCLRGIIHSLARCHHQNENETICIHVGYNKTQRVHKMNDNTAILKF